MNHVVDIGIDGILVLKWLLMKGHEGMDCIRLVRGGLL
jgi:hypothetical protein